MDYISEFSNIYHHVIEEIHDVGIAEKLDSPVCMNRDGEECKPIIAFSCKVTHRIKQDMCIVGDEVGGNSSQKGYGHFGGTLNFC